MTDQPRPQPIDFALADHGTIAVLTPKSAAARAWCEEHLPEDAQRLGAGYAIEPRYADPILDGIAEEGLSVSS